MFASHLLSGCSKLALGALEPLGSLSLGSANGSNLLVGIVELSLKLRDLPQEIGTFLSTLTDEDVAFLRVNENG